MPQLPKQLITTRARAAVAVGVTGFVLALAIRDLLRPHTEDGWLLPMNFMLHGWTLLAANLAFYSYLCWLGFWLIFNARGNERGVMVGWFAMILLSPLRRVRPDWTLAINYFNAFSLAVAVLAAVSLFLHLSAQDTDAQLGGNGQQ